MDTYNDMLIYQYKKSWVIGFSFLGTKGFCLAPLGHLLHFWKCVLCVELRGGETISLGEDGPVFDFARDPDKKNLTFIKQRWGALMRKHIFYTSPDNV